MTLNIIIFLILVFQISFSFAGGGAGGEGGHGGGPRVALMQEITNPVEGYNISYSGDCGSIGGGVVLGTENIMNNK